MSLRSFIKKEKRWKKLRLKRGSYLVEAALTLPVFILSVIALALLISIISVCENISMVTALEMRDFTTSVSARNYLNSVSLCKQIEKSVSEECEKLTDFQVKEAKLFYQKNEIDDLIGIVTESRFTVDNPIGIYGKIQFEEKLVVRGYTGALQDSAPLAESEFRKTGRSEPVIVYPKYGKRYHRKSCRYAKEEYAGEKYQLEMEKEDAVRKGFTGCLVCGGGT